MVREISMANGFEDFQKFSKTQLDTAAVTSQSLAKGLQAIAAETTDYSKKSLENSSAFLEKLLGVKSIETAIQLQTEYAKSAYADFVAQVTKFAELYSNLAKDAFKPIETAIAQAQAAKD
jgi:phasin family protein